MKKVIVLFVVVFLIVLSVVPCSALAWKNISEKDVINSSNANIQGSVFTIRDYLNENIYNNIQHSSYRLYLTIDIIEKAGSGNLSTLINRGVFDQSSYFPLIEGAKTELKVVDVSDKITFYSDDCLKPIKVYYNGFGTSLNQQKYIGIKRKTYNGSNYEWWYTPGNYTIDFSYSRITQGAYDVFRFILVYDIDSASFPQISSSNMLGFTVSNAQISLNPLFLYNGQPGGTPYIGEVLIVPQSCYATFKNPMVYVPRPVAEQNSFYVVSSTNLFSPLTYVPELIAPLQNYTPSRTSNHQLMQNYVFDRSNGTRVTYYQDLDYNPFCYLPDSEVGNVYGYTAFDFDNVQTMPYGYKLEGENLRYNFTPLTGTGSINNVRCGYIYNCNLSSSDATHLNCNDLRFSFFLRQSYDEIYYTQNTTSNTLQLDGADISQFYKDISVKFSTDEGIVKGLSRFFADLFTVTLPNIINNFIVWFMCESPLISTITQPLYLFARISGNYVVQYLLPLVAGLGSFGIALFVIFFVKRLISVTGINNGGGS